MASGTVFTILRKYQVNSKSAPPWRMDEVISEYESKCVSDLPLDGERFKDLPKHPKFMTLKDGERDFMNAETGDYYVKVSEFGFNSCLNGFRQFLIDEFSMNPYFPWNSQLSVTPRMAEEMLFAINYLLYGKYDAEIERYLDNPYIEPLGDLCPAYSRWKYSQMFKGDDDGFSDEEDLREILESIKAVLTVFLRSELHEEYVLFIEIW